MNRKFQAIYDSLVAAAFVATVAGICLGLIDYLVVNAGEHVLEGWSLVPHGWGSGHPGAIDTATAVITVPAIAAIGIFIYRMSRSASRARGEG